MKGGRRAGRLSPAARPPCSRLLLQRWRTTPSGTATPTPVNQTQELVAMWGYLNTSQQTAAPRGRPLVYLQSRGGCGNDSCQQKQHVDTWKQLRAVLRGENTTVRWQPCHKKLAHSFLQTSAANDECGTKKKGGHSVYLIYNNVVTVCAGPELGVYADDLQGSGHHVLRLLCAARRLSEHGVQEGEAEGESRC